MSNPIQELFVQLGFEFDPSKMAALVTASQKLAETEARAQEMIADARKAAGLERERAAAKAAFEATEEGKAHLAWKAGEEAKKQTAHDAAKQKQKAEQEAQKQREEQQKRSHGQRVKDLTVEAEKEKEAYLARKAFEATEEGKRHAAFMRQVQDEEEMRHPVSGFADLLGKGQAVGLNALGKAIGDPIGALAKRIPSLNTALEKLGLGSDNAKGRLQVLLGVAAAGVGIIGSVVRSAFAWAGSFAQESEQLRETARDARVTTSELQALQHAGVESGVGADRVTTSVAALGERLRQASLHMGGSGVGGTLRRMGISMRDTRGQVRPTVDVLDDLAVQLDKVRSPRRRERIVESLGMDRRMLEILHGGAGGIRALREEMWALGGGVTPEAIAAGRQFTQAQDRWKRSTDSLRSVLAVALLPTLSWLVTKLALLQGYVARVTQGTHVMQIALVVLGMIGAAVALSMLAAFAPVIAPFLAAAGAAAFLGLVLDDLITFIEGGDSALGRFIDKTFGLGTSAEFARDIRESWADIGRFFEAASSTIDKLIEQFPRLAEAARLASAPLRAVLNPVGALAGLARRFAGSGNAAPAALPGGVNGPLAEAARTGAALPSVRVPVSRSVSAPGGGGGRSVTRVTTRSQVNHFALSGTSEQLVAQVQAKLEEQQRAQQDGAHPQEENDG